MSTPTRRDFLKLAGLAALGAASACQTSQPAPTAIQTPQAAQPSASATALPGKKRVLRIAHMTDFHVWSLNGAPGGMKRALRHAQSQLDPPDILVNTGDSIMESLNSLDKGAVEAQWEVYNSILKSECRLPVIHAIGNHDVWGWGHPDAPINSDPLYGKNMALEKLGLEKPCYSFDRAGWHFVVLDSIHLPNDASSYPYIGQLDEEQFQWLTADINGLAASNTPICILSHIPIVAACEYFDGPNEASGNWVVPGSWIHLDARRFRDYFLQIPNVRLCLSGHAHQYESLDYLGIRYITSGAVCGNWWDGDYMNFPPAYVMVDLYKDGTAESQFVPYDRA